MSEKDLYLEGIPAGLYAVLWQTREMGFLKKILRDQNIDELSIVIFFRDYAPGALLVLDGDEGDFRIQGIYSLDGLNYDAAIIGHLRPIVKSFEGHFLLNNFWNFVSGKVKFKGFLKLFKFLKVLMRCAI